MPSIIEVVEGERVGMPLSKGGWGFVEAKQNGVVIAVGNEGVFVTEADLLEMGYASCTPSDSEKASG